MCDFKTINGLDYIPLITHYPIRKDECTEDEEWPNLNEHPDGDGYISNVVQGMHQPRRSTRLVAQKNHPTIRKSQRPHKQSAAKFKSSVMTHPKFGCKNMKEIIHMSKQKSLTHFPTKLTALTHPCHICIHCKMPKLHRNPTSVLLALLRPGQML